MNFAGLFIATAISNLKSGIILISNGKRYKERYLDEIGPQNAAMIPHLEVEIDIQLYSSPLSYSAVFPGLRSISNLVKTKCMIKTDVRTLSQGRVEIIDPSSSLVHFNCTAAGKNKRLDLIACSTMPPPVSELAFFHGSSSAVKKSVDSCVLVFWDMRAA